MKLSLAGALTVIKRANAQRERQIDPYDIVSCWQAGAYYNELKASARAIVISKIGVINFFKIKKCSQ